MKITINTENLQSLVAKAVRGASNNKMMPITSLMLINATDSGLELVTTDASNYLFIKDKSIVGDFYAVVPVDTFSKLICRLTSAEVSLEVDDDKLTVKGNGTYHIELPLDEEGERVVYPNPIKNFDKKNCVTTTIEYDVIRQMLISGKPALATSLDVPCYTGFYADERIIATDTDIICGIDACILDEPALLDASAISLLDIVPDNTISADRCDDEIIFSESFNNGNTTLSVYTRTMPEIVDYNVDVITELLQTEFDSTCKVSKDIILQVLDRISLFVGIYDDNKINLIFSENGLTISSKMNSSTETIPFVAVNNFRPFTCEINVNMFRTQIKANICNAIEIQYGRDNAIKLTDGSITQILALE